MRMFYHFIFVLFHQVKINFWESTEDNTHYEYKMMRTRAHTHTNTPHTKPKKQEKNKVSTDWTRTSEDKNHNEYLDKQERISWILVNYGHQTIQPYSDASSFDGGCCKETKTYPISLPQTSNKFANHNIQLLFSFTCNSGTISLSFCFDEHVLRFHFSVVALFVKIKTKYSWKSTYVTVHTKCVRLCSKKKKKKKREEKNTFSTDWSRTCEDEDQMHLDGQERISRILVN